MMPVILALGLGLIALTGETSVINAHGTLGVSITTKEGWTVCADKRIYDAVSGDQDIATKIYSLSNKVLVLSTGASMLVETTTNGGAVSTGPTVFSADEVIRRLAQTKPFADTSQFWSMLIDALIDELERILDSNQSKPVLDSPPNFQSIFSWVGADDRLHQFRIAINYQDTRRISYRTQVYAPLDEARTEMGGYGSLDVYDEILHGRDARFDDLRQDKDIRRFAVDRPARSEISTAEAESFARRFIRLSSERTPLLLASSGHIGPTSDCLSVTKDGVQQSRFAR